MFVILQVWDKTSNNNTHKLHYITSINIMTQIIIRYKGRLGTKKSGVYTFLKKYLNAQVGDLNS